VDAIQPACEPMESVQVAVEGETTGHFDSSGADHGYWFL